MHRARVRVHVAVQRGAGLVHVRLAQVGHRHRIGVAEHPEDPRHPEPDEHEGDQRLEGLGQARGHRDGERHDRDAGRATT